MYVRPKIPVHINTSFIRTTYTRKYLELMNYGTA